MEGRGLSSRQAREVKQDRRLGVDREDFVAIDAYGAERWLGKLAQSLKHEAY